MDGWHTEGPETSYKGRGTSNGGTRRGSVDTDEGNIPGGNPDFSESPTPVAQVCGRVLGYR